VRILCVSDHKDPIVYSSQVKKRFKDIDLVLGAGDLDMSYYGFIVSSLNKPLLFVFGNHNLEKISYFKKRFQSDYEDPTLGTLARRHSYGSTCIGGRVVREKGLIIAGLGGSRRYNKELNQYTEVQMYMQIFRMAPKLIWNKVFRGRHVDILLTHAAPFGIGDRPDLCHLGFRAFLSFMKWFRPTYLIHGHIHLYDMNAEREFSYLGTRIVNAYNHTVVEIEARA
jgi:uncharacterized protein